MLYMFSQLTKRCMQTSYYKINNFNINVRCLSQVPIKEQESPKPTVVSEKKKILLSKYTGYKTIYKFPRIQYISMYNKFKIGTLIASCITIPVLGILDGLDIITSHTGMTISVIACSSTVALFTIGMLCENYIGFIYYKDDNNIKIAYVDTWGKRRDIDTSKKDIQSLTLASSTITDKFYRTLHLKSLKFPLKLTINNIAIYDEELLAAVIGDY